MKLSKISKKHQKCLDILSAMASTIQWEFVELAIMRHVDMVQFNNELVSTIDKMKEAMGMFPELERQEPVEQDKPEKPEKAEKLKKPEKVEKPKKEPEKEYDQFGFRTGSTSAKINKLLLKSTKTKKQIAKDLDITTAAVQQHFHRLKNKGCKL